MRDSRRGRNKGSDVFVTIYLHCYSIDTANSQVKGAGMRRIRSKSRRKCVCVCVCVCLVGEGVGWLGRYTNIFHSDERKVEIKREP